MLYLVPVVWDRGVVRGVVTSVDNNLAMAVLSIGAENSVRRGQVFILKRVDLQIGRAQVRTVTADMSEIGIFEFRGRGGVQVGDTAILQRGFWESTKVRLWDLFGN